MSVQESYYKDSELQMSSKMIICIEEHNSGITDNVMFIGWHDDLYFIRGKRRNLNNSNDFVPYAFHCDTSKQLMKFIKLIIYHSDMNVSLYNYNNIQTTSSLEFESKSGTSSSSSECSSEMNLDDLTFEFFEDLMHLDYEIVGFDNVTLEQIDMNGFLSVIRDFYN